MHPSKLWYELGLSAGALHAPSMPQRNTHHSTITTTPLEQHAQPYAPPLVGAGRKTVYAVHASICYITAYSYSHTPTKSSNNGTSMVQCSH